MILPPNPCPTCNQQTRVYESRKLIDGSGTLRKRRCLSCDHTYATVQTKNGPEKLYENEGPLPGIARKGRKLPARPRSQGYAPRQPTKLYEPTVTEKIQTIIDERKAAEWWEDA